MVRLQPTSLRVGVGRLSRAFALPGLLAAVLLCLWAPAGAADKAAVNASIQRGAQWLASTFATIQDDGDRALAALALLKSNMPPTAAPIQAIISETLQKCESGKYQPGAHHIYEAGVVASILVDADAVKYAPQLKMISEYLQGQQLPNGGWDYPSGRAGRGDTSVVQYACLGLWAAERAGHPVPSKVWENAIRWHIATQIPDGGFTYVPGTEEGAAAGRSSLNMTAAGLSSLLICARFAYPGQADDLTQLLAIPKSDREATTEAGTGPLVKVDLTTAPPPEGASPVPQDTALPIEQTRNVVRKAYGWIDGRFIPVRHPSFGDQDPHWKMYYQYTMERMASLANRDTIGRYKWYDDGAEFLVKAQQQDGSWFLDPQYAKPYRDTAFILLFLSRSTGKVLQRTMVDPTYGGGLLTGGKGEPTEVVAKKKDPTPLDQLLASLQNPGSLDLAAAQTDLVQQIQLGDRTELIGQKEQLVQLIQHPHGEVRRTAAWALGRTNDLHLARYLIDAIEDPDLGVMIEAHAALCWLSRRFDGFGLPVNPLDALPESASDEEKQTAIRGWRVRARREWGNWYLKVRPYSDRGDEFEARLRQRLGDK